MFLMLFLLISFINRNQSTTVVKFQKDGFLTADSFLRFKGQLKSTDQISVCFRLKIYQPRSLSTILSYGLPDFKTELYIALNFEKQLLLISCCMNKLLSSSPVNVLLYHWVSFCISLDLKTKVYSLVQDGKQQTIIDRSRFVNENGIILNGTGVAYLGQDQDSNAKQFNPFQSLSGELADFYLLKTSLSGKEMEDFTNCINDIEGPSMINFLDVENDFVIQNVSVEEVTRNLCREITFFYRIFNERKNFKEAAFFCHSVGGKLVYPTKEAENDKLFEVTSSSFLCNEDNTYYNDALWLGIIVDQSNQTWKHYLEDTPIDYTNFSPMERKSLKEYRCVTLYSCASRSENWHAKWLMRKCTHKRKVVCGFDDIPVLRLRGLCKDSLFDRRYVLPPHTQEPIFHGYSYSRIVPGGPENETGGNWIIKRKDRPELRAESERHSIMQYPVGRKRWTIFNDACSVSNKELQLTICQPGEFSCSDGSCISLFHRCDLRFHCPDGSDEEYCHPLILPSRYSTKIPPPTLGDQKANEISILVYLLNILSINVETFRISMELYIKSSWIDPRLRFKNLKMTVDETGMESLKGAVWTPKFQFQGPSNTSCDIRLRKSTFSVTQNSQPLLDDDENISEDLIFEGAENPIVLEMIYTISSFCRFDLEEYPFDSQKCELNIGLKGSSPETFRLVLEGEGINYFGPKKFLEYEKKNISVSVYEEKGLASIKLVFRNLVMYYLASTFLPTLMILIIGYLPFYFPIVEYNERIMVSVTALLVQSSFFTEVNDSIPKTVYLKKIDIWCIFCIVMMFGVTVALTIINYIRDKEQTRSNHVTPVINVKESWFMKSDRPVGNSSTSKSSSSLHFSKKLNMFCRVIFPACSLLFIAWYISKSLENYYA